MGGGGGFFAPIVQAVGDIVNSASKAVGGSDHVMDTPASQRQDAQKAQQAAQQAAQAEAAKMRANSPQASAGPETEGGTPTAYATSQAKQAAGSAAALSGSQQAVNQSAGSGTMLTGNQGIDPQSLELGRRTLLGG